MIRPNDSIVLPRRSTRADGVDPDLGSGERAIFSHPGKIFPDLDVGTLILLSGRYIAQTDVRPVKAIATVTAFSETCYVNFYKNDGEEIGFMEITGYQQQVRFEVPFDFKAEADFLTVQVSGPHFAVTNLTIFVTFEPSPPR